MIKYFGKYRAVVADNKDPMNLGRIKAKVLAVFGNVESGWALPCLPYAGREVGFFFSPPIGANVWIEFEAGNPDYPIWSGCFWGNGESVPGDKVIKTDSATLRFDESGEGELTIENSTGLKISLATREVILSDDSSSVRFSVRKLLKLLRSCKNWAP